MENLIFNPKTYGWEEKQIEMKLKVVTLYSVRYYKEGEATSYRVGWRGGLRNLKMASRLVKRLKKSGVNAFKVPMKVSIMVKK